MVKFSPLARFCKACVAKRNVEYIQRSCSATSQRDTPTVTEPVEVLQIGASDLPPLSQKPLFFGKEEEDVGGIHNPRRCHCAEIRDHQ